MILGFLGAAIMGLTLGLIGGGGSILAVPILVYLFGIPGAQATYYSLFVVGLCAAVGSVPYAKRGLVQLGTGLLFFFPSVAGVMISRRLLLPSIPPQLSVAGVSLTKDALILGAFAVVMLAAAISMLRKKPPKAEADTEASPFKTGVGGIAVGVVTGFVGAGGGFLIVPALVNGLSLPMEKAIGTSLLVIALNSLSGFAGDWLSGMPADWPLILPFSAAALVGIAAGTSLNRRVPAARLKPAFGWFVLILGTAMIVKQVLELQ